MNDLKLWYTNAALNWSQGLPLGNGRLGSVIYGGIEKETWSMTEVTYWSGKTEKTKSYSKGKDDLDRMRQHFFTGNYKRGEELAQQALQPKKQNFGTNLQMCNLILNVEHHGEDLQRVLSLENALFHTSYSVNGKNFTREIFASHADDIVASRFWSEQKGGISFTLGMEGLTDNFTKRAAEDAVITFKGQATENMHSDGKCGVFCQGMVKVTAQGGTIIIEDNQIVVRNADEACIYFAANTDYGKKDEGWLQASKRQLAQAIALGYAKLKENHISDYHRLYGRVNLDLGHSAASYLPTDERIRLFQNGQDDDPQLFALFYQYGRYLMISGSRADSPLPLNLQGIWNDGEANRMQWSCDYHLDINTQMNYFPTEASNLAECHIPLMNYLEMLSQAGRTTAHDFYGCEGWVAHVFSNAWGFTAPGWETSWGLNVTGGLWIASQLREHYEFSLDQEFLAQQVYPVLKEAAAFFLDYMTMHPQYGWLVTGPSNSPENSFYIEDNVHQLSMGSTLDQVLVRDLFVFCLEAADMLQVDFDMQTKLKQAIAKLPPLRIGSRGQLQEWLEDFKEAQPDHRHLSHLVSLHPGNQITLRGTPELSAAARTTLENRMSREALEDVEFTVASFSASFARLEDGEHAYKHLTHLIGQLSFDNLLTFSKPGIAGAEKHIFVVDGNFGGTAAIAEMLLQSHAGEINLLPALPRKWHTGKVSGLRAKGNIEVDIVWENGKLMEATIQAFSDGRTFLRFREQSVPLDLTTNTVYKIDKLLKVTQKK
ncbi:glycosyl hydrolase family 95 catalytic domain-containing protein [Paenibacillus sp. Soil724D2]|uniref:glycoside hydrolase family 95 protein n=1 Tax=Paenibacillus sp. (strain Soil724D2) TaxID=1736392 RepID=UPI00071518AD|nr:glycoside hydrolase family 95 protein [Paenibacillus sp. Soil724D2]KRE46826.1 alpha-L-fucosidase [Paenibacillus sp. Soil724D2]